MRSKDYIPNILKEDLGDLMIRTLLKKQPELTVTQVRRIFGYNYGRLYGRERNKIHGRQKKLSKLS